MLGIEHLRDALERIVTETGRTDEQSGWRLGVVSYLNAKPLVMGLDKLPGMQLMPDVPARLPDLLAQGGVDAALVPVIDLFNRAPAWQRVSDACIASDGQTLTVRVFSRVPPDRIRRLHVDGDSHTSVALARVLWAEQYDRSLEIVPFVPGDPDDDAEAVLLIGDKVVCRAPKGYPVEVDLGEAWKAFTSLPFVFAVWVCRAGRNLDDLARVLMAARDEGVAAAASLAHTFGPPAGWPVALARQYLTSNLQYTLDQRYLAGLDRFRALAEKHGMLRSARKQVAS